jgi:Tfp pilus assembly protein PilX
MNLVNRKTRTEFVARRRPNRRSGAVLVVVLVCLTVAAIMLVVVARQAGIVRRAVERSQSSLQAQWLAEAGAERAVARLASDPAYAGETWRISAKELGTPNDAEVRITIKKVASQPGRVAVGVEADYPRDVLLRCRRAKQIEVDREQIAPPQAARAPR